MMLPKYYGKNKYTSTCMKRTGDDWGGNIIRQHLNGRVLDPPLGQQFERIGNPSYEYGACAVLTSTRTRQVYGDGLHFV